MLPDITANRKGVAGPRIISCYSLLGSPFTNVHGNKLAIVFQKVWKKASASFEIPAAFEHKSLVISAEHNIQFLLMSPMNTSYLQTILNQLAIHWEVSSGSFSVCFCSGGSIKFTLFLVSLWIGINKIFKGEMWFHKTPKDPPVFGLPV